MTRKPRKPERPSPFSRRERARLWLSYQRYAMLGAGGVTAMLGGVAALGMAWTWGWAALIVAGPLSLSLGRFSVEVLRAHPRKLRATWAHQRRIDGQRFSPAAIKTYCGDPCWRVVADEVLTRAGIPAGSRRELIRQFRAELDDENNSTVIVDHTTGTIRRISAAGETYIFNSNHPQISTSGMLEPAAPSPHFEPGPTS
jgi:hypothetical protein